MTPNALEKIVATALHPGTDEATAVVAFRHLHRNASKFGGLTTILGGGGADLRQRFLRAQNEAVELRSNIVRIEERLSQLGSEHRNTLRDLAAERARAAEAQATSREMVGRIAALEAELIELKAKGGDDELGIIAQHHAQIETLAVKLKSLTKALSEAEAKKEEYAAALTEAAVRDLARRVRAALDGSDGSPKPDDTEDKPQRENTTRARRATGKRQAYASAKPRARTSRAKRRGADTEGLVLDLLTYDWKTVSTLYRAVQRIGFSGSENAVRFAAERLVESGNAVKGFDDDGRIAFRRA